MDEDGNMKEPEKVPESELQEIIPEDKAAVIQPISGEYSVWVIHQHAQRLIRQEIAKEMRRIVPELNNIDLDDFQFKIEKEAVKFEDKFI